MKSELLIKGNKLTTTNETKIGISVKKRLKKKTDKADRCSQKL